MNDYDDAPTQAKSILDEVEESILGSFLLEPSRLAESDVKPEELANTQRRRILDVMLRLGVAADVVTVHAALARDVEGFDKRFLLAAMESVPSAHNLPAYVAQLRALRQAGSTHGGRAVVLTPGAHTVGGSYLSVGTDRFADRVLAAFPPGILYRRGNDVGLVVGEPGKRRFEPLTDAASRRLVDGHVALFASAGKPDRPDAMPEPQEGPATAAPGDALRFVPCSRDLASLISDAARSHPKVRDLVMLTTFPVYRPDWTLSPPGFDAGIYYDEPPDLSDLKRPPVSVIYDALTDFPFRDDASRFNAIGLMLTPLIRHAVGNVPFHLVHSSMERTGKTKLVEMIGQIVTGDAPPAIQVSEREEENEKRVTSAMRAGKPILFFDNLRDYLDSASLAALATARVWEGRVLGSSTLAAFPNRSTVVLTGNNVRATGELVKRTVPILLQPRDGTPENRTDFVHPDLDAFITSERPAILGALLGLVDAWRARGAPPGPHRMGGFEAWARAVGGILDGSPWLGNASAWRRAANPEGEDLALLVRAWEERHGLGMQHPAATIAEMAQAAGIFPACFTRPGPGAVISFARRVLAASQDRPVGDRIIRRVGSGSSSYWSLQAV